MDAPVEETRSTNEDDDHDDEREEEEDVSAWSWGAGTNGQLGTGAARDEHLPQPLSLNTLSSSSSPPLCVSRVACGGAHAVALTGDGRVLTWGRGMHGQLGHGELENCLQPKPVKFFESFTLCSVSAGWNHSGFVTGPSTWRATERAKLLDLLLGRIGFYSNQKKRGSFQQKASPINDVLEMNTA